MTSSSHNGWAFPSIHVALSRGIQAVCTPRQPQRQQQQQEKVTVSSVTENGTNNNNNNKSSSSTEENQASIMAEEQVGLKQEGKVANEARIQKDKNDDDSSENNATYLSSSSPSPSSNIAKQSTPSSKTSSSPPLSPGLLEEHSQDDENDNGCLEMIDHMGATTSQAKRGVVVVAAGAAVRRGPPPSSCTCLTKGQKTSCSRSSAAPPDFAPWILPPNDSKDDGDDETVVVVEQVVVATTIPTGSDKEQASVKKPAPQQQQQQQSTIIQLSSKGIGTSKTQDLPSRRRRRKCREETTFAASSTETAVAHDNRHKNDRGDMHVEGPRQGRAPRPRGAATANHNNMTMTTTTLCSESRVLPQRRVVRDAATRRSSRRNDENGKTKKDVTNAVTATAAVAASAGKKRARPPPMGKQQAKNAKRKVVTLLEPACVKRRASSSSSSRTIERSWKSEKDARSGPWTLQEELLFLHGLNVRYGRYARNKRKWIAISEEFVRTRSSLQVKTHGRPIVRQLLAGEDVFEPLRRNGELVEELLAKLSASECNAVYDSKVASSSRSAKKASNTDNASDIDRNAHTYFNEGFHKSSLESCSDQLKGSYDDAEKIVAGYFGGCDVPGASDIGPLRDGIAKLWCRLARLAAEVIEESDSRMTRSGADQRRGLNVEMLLLDIARSCPLVGDHHEVIRARLKLELGDAYDFLQTNDAGTMEGWSESLENIREQPACIVGVLASSIALCNNAVRKSPLDLPSPYATLADLFSRDGKLKTRQRWIADSSTVLVGSVAALRSLWHPSHRVIDRTSVSTICLEANRLSRIKEALLSLSVEDDGESDDDLVTEVMGTEYGCDRGCWSVFATKRELLEHQKACGGDRVALGEHDRFECGKLGIYGDGMAFNDIGGLEESETFEDEDDFNTTWSSPGTHCLVVEYGCQVCCDVFESEEQLFEHQQSCSDRNCATGDGPTCSVEAEMRKLGAKTGIEAWCD